MPSSLNFFSSSVLTPAKSDSMKGPFYSSFASITCTAVESTLASAFVQVAFVLLSLNRLVVRIYLIGPTVFPLHSLSIYCIPLNVLLPFGARQHPRTTHNHRVLVVRKKGQNEAKQMEWRVQFLRENVIPLDTADSALLVYSCILLKLYNLHQFRGTTDPYLHTETHQTEHDANCTFASHNPTPNDIQNAQLSVPLWTTDSIVGFPLDRHSLVFQ